MPIRLENRLLGIVPLDDGTVRGRASLAAMRRRLAALAGLLASALALGGCVSIQAISSGQQDIVGKLRLTLTVCASGMNDLAGPNEDHPDCPDMGNSGLWAFEGAGGASAPAQVLLGLRLPVDAVPPETVTATPEPAPPATGTITLRPSSTYEAELQAAVPAPAGFRWAGYLSDPYDFTDGPQGTSAQRAQVAIDIDLPRPSDGAPFVGPLSLRPVVGARLVEPDKPASRPVECGASPFDTWPSGFAGDTICIDSPLATSADQIAANFDFPTRDFGIVSGNATASPGQTVSLPFGVRGVGALPAGLTASLAASTTLPGAGAAPSLSSAPLSNGSDTRVTVPVAIPADAAAGAYEVVLIGRLENGQERSGVAQLTVRARPPVPDASKPRLSAARIEPKTFKAATRKRPKRGTGVSYSLSEAASVRVVVERCAKYAKPKGGRRAKRSGADVAVRRRRAVERGRCLRFAALAGPQTKAGKAGANEFRFNGRVRGRALKPGPYRLALTPTDAAGNRGGTARVGFAIRR